MPDNIVPDQKKEAGEALQKTNAPSSTTQTSSEIDDVIITPDDGPIEHVKENVAEAEEKIQHTAPATTDPLAWQGTPPLKNQTTLSPSGDSLSALRERIARAQEKQKAVHNEKITPPSLKKQEDRQEKKNPVETLPLTTPTTTALRSLRTFKSDIDQVVARRQVSVVSALAAEQNRQTKKNTFSEPVRSGFFSPLAYIILGVSITLFVIGGVAIGVAFYFSKSPSSVLKADQIPGYISVEDQQAVKTDGLTRSYLMSILIKGQQALDTKVGSITQVYFTKNVPDATTNESVTTLLSTNEFFSIFEFHAPDSLVRALDPKMMLGFYQFDQVRPFIILKTTAYEIAFAGMLSWERDINADLAPLFGPVLAQELPRQFPKEVETVLATSSGLESTSSSTSFSNTNQTVGNASSSSSSIETLPTTSTTPEAPTVFVPHTFEDVVVKNKDARILRDASGKVALMYGFYDKETIIITNDENTFKEIVTRLASRRF